MERSIVVEENYCKSNVNAVSKSDGSFIQINPISIDLVSAKDKRDAGNLTVLYGVASCMGYQCSTAVVDAALVLLGNIISYSDIREILNLMKESPKSSFGTC